MKWLKYWESHSEEPKYKELVTDSEYQKIINTFSLVDITEDDVDFIMHHISKVPKEIEKVIGSVLGPITDGREINYLSLYFKNSEDIDYELDTFIVVEKLQDSYYMVGSADGSDDDVKTWLCDDIEGVIQCLKTENTFIKPYMKESVDLGS